MTARRRRTSLWLILLLVTPALAANDAAAPPYMGQEPPGLVPKVFAPGVICLADRGEGSICFTQDWRECYFDAGSPAGKHIMVTRYEGGSWTPPEKASFSDGRCFGPSLADNDRSLYFIRERYTIWRVRRVEQGWSEPEVLPSPVNLDPPASQSNVSCHISSLGNMWICSWRPGGLGQCDLWRIRFSDGRFTEAAHQRDLNSDASDCTAVPGPDESYVVLRSNRPGGFGNGDLYVGFADGKGGWTAPKNLGAAVNTPDWEDAPSLSPDNKYLFFSRSSSGDKNIYWVSVRAFLVDPNAAGSPLRQPAGTTEGSK